ncbi:MAG: class I SAM-dependent methyltransferase [Bacteroidota bacterium]
MQQLHECPVCQSVNFQSYIQTKAQMHPSEEQFNFDRCSDCDLVFLNPRVPPADLMDYYTDYYLPYRGPQAWGKYESMVAGSQVKLDKKRADLIQKYHSVNPTTLILDVGCGQPSFLQQCTQQFNCQGMGIDFSDEGWKENATYQHLDLHVGEVDDLPQDLRADVITMWHYLEHDYEPLKNLSSLRKRAKASTTIFIEIPNFASESRRKFGKDWAGWHTPRHTSLFSPNNVRTLLKNSGWEAQEVLTYGTLDPYVLYWMSRMEQKGIEWDKNMEEEFVGFVAGMIGFFPKKLMEKQRSLGVMTVIAQPK